MSDVAPGQDGAGNWWNEIRRESYPGELDEIRATLRVCPACGERGELWASYPYWCVYCDCATTLEFDEPGDAAEAFNAGQTTPREDNP